MPFPPLEFKNQTLRLLDQRKLPAQETWIVCRKSSDVFRSIQNMTVRGAPAIGVTAGYGLYLGVRSSKSKTRNEFFRHLREEAEYLKQSRPTAVNLMNVIDGIVKALENSSAATISELKKSVLNHAIRFHREDDSLCRRIGKNGQVLFKNGDRVLTHCNAGGLATSGYGTALGVLYAVKERRKKISVWVDETRPLLQGARLTAWELMKSKIPCTLVCDNSAASLMRQGKVDRIIVGADRIAANGDMANKIGTYNLAVLAKEHGIPFYVAAPSTTFDFSISSGKQIPIEERNPDEVTRLSGKVITPKNMRALNYAFDMTPHSYITAFITEAGVLKPPFSRSFTVIASPGGAKQSQGLLRRPAASSQ